MLMQLRKSPQRHSPNKQRNTPITSNQVNGKITCGWTKPDRKDLTQDNPPMVRRHSQGSEYAG